MANPADSGWHQLNDLLSTAKCGAILAACHQLRTAPETERRTGDNPYAGTHHLVLLNERIPAVSALLRNRALLDVVTSRIGPSFELLEASYRSPQPGYGGQKLHTDGVPKLHDGPETIATAIVALVPFGPDNGATRVVPGSHRRPDLQRLAGNLDHHRDEVHLTGPAGTGFVFSGHLLHSGTTNRTIAERSALQLMWQCANT